MSIDYMSLGPTPCDEPCAQVGADDYSTRYRIECNAYCKQLIRMFGEPPDGARLITKGFPHDFGMYHEVVVEYNRETADYAMNVERNLPGRWDEEALNELAKTN